MPCATAADPCPIRWGAISVAWNDPCKPLKIAIAHPSIPETSLVAFFQHHLIDTRGHDGDAPHRRYKCSVFGLDTCDIPLPAMDTTQFVAVGDLGWEVQRDFQWHNFEDRRRWQWKEYRFSPG